MTRAFGEIAERLRRSTVLVQAGGRDRGGGSGVIWSADGLIVTNAHVARTPRPAVELWDGRRLTAEVVERDPRRDLASLRVAAADLPAATAGDSAAIRPGEIVIAVGNPLGFTGALTTGVVHSLGPVPGMGAQNWVRAGVRLAPGNSGGPLADAHGRVIGINTAIVAGLGLAVPSNSVAAFLGRGARPVLGVSVQPAGIGLLLVGVARGGAADLASLWVGDILTAAGGSPLRTPDDLAEVLATAGPVLDFQFLRGDRSRPRHAAVRLAGRAAEAA